MPKDFKLSSDTETFTVQVLYDTLELYGKVNASRTITIARQ